MSAPQRCGTLDAVAAQRPEWATETAPTQAGPAWFGWYLLLRIDDEAKGAAKRLDSVAISRGRPRGIRLLVAEQVKRMAVPGDLREMTRLALRAAQAVGE